MFSWGKVVAELRSKHGVILECHIETDNGTAKNGLESYGASLVGKRYGFVEQNISGDGPSTEVSAWLNRSMS